MELSASKKHNKPSNVSVGVRLDASVIAQQQQAAHHLQSKQHGIPVELKNASGSLRHSSQQRGSGSKQLKKNIPTAAAPANGTILHTGSSNIAGQFSAGVNSVDDVGARTRKAIHVDTMTRQFVTQDYQSADMTAILHTGKRPLECTDESLVINGSEQEEEPNANSNCLNTLRVNTQTPKASGQEQAARKSLPELLVEYEASSSPPPLRNDGLIEPRFAPEPTKPVLAGRARHRIGGGTVDVIHGVGSGGSRMAASSKQSLVDSQFKPRMRQGTAGREEEDGKFDQEVDLLASARSSPRWQSREGGSSVGRSKHRAARLDVNTIIQNDSKKLRDSTPKASANRAGSQEFTKQSRRTQQRARKDRVSSMSGARWAPSGSRHTNLNLDLANVENDMELSATIPGEALASHFLQQVGGDPVTTIEQVEPIELTAEINCALQVPENIFQNEDKKEEVSNAILAKSGTIPASLEQTVQNAGSVSRDHEEDTVTPRKAAVSKLLLNTLDIDNRNNNMVLSNYYSLSNKEEQNERLTVPGPGSMASPPLPEGFNAERLPQRRATDEGSMLLKSTVNLIKPNRKSKDSSALLAVNGVGLTGRQDVATLVKGSEPSNGAGKSSWDGAARAQNLQSRQVVKEQKDLDDKSARIQCETTEMDESLASDSVGRGGHTDRLKPAQKGARQVPFVRVRTGKDGELRTSLASNVWSSPHDSDLPSDRAARANFARQQREMEAAIAEGARKGHLYRGYCRYMTKVAKQEKKQEVKPQKKNIFRPDTDFVEKIKERHYESTCNQLDDEKGTFFRNMKILKATQHENGQYSAAGQIIDDSHIAQLQTNGRNQRNIRIKTVGGTAPQSAKSINNIVPAFSSLQTDDQFEASKSDLKTSRQANEHPSISAVYSARMLKDISRQHRRGMALTIKSGLRSNKDLEIAERPKYLEDSKYRVDIGEPSSVAKESYRPRLHRLDFEQLTDSYQTLQAARLQDEIKQLYRDKLVEHREKYGFEMTAENQAALSEALGVELDLPTVTEREHEVNLRDASTTRSGTIAVSSDLQEGKDDARYLRLSHRDVMSGQGLLSGRAPNSGFLSRRLEEGNREPITSSLNTVRIENMFSDPRRNIMLRNSNTGHVYKVQTHRGHMSSLTPATTIMSRASLTAAQASRLTSGMARKPTHQKHLSNRQLMKKYSRQREEIKDKHEKWLQDKIAPSPKASYKQPPAIQPSPKRKQLKGPPPLFQGYEVKKLLESEGGRDSLAQTSSSAMNKQEILELPAAEPKTETEKLLRKLSLAGIGSAAQDLTSKHFDHEMKKDLKYHRELLQRRNQELWMSKRRLGKRTMSQLIVQAPKNYGQYEISGPPATLEHAFHSERDEILRNGQILPKFLPQRVRRNSMGCGYNTQDGMNTSIMRFASLLFQIWMNDYLSEVEHVKDRNNNYGSYQLNGNVERNVKDNCLPIDYFIKRVISIGLCHSMAQVRDVLRIMGVYENAGHQQYSKPADKSSSITGSRPELSHRKSFLETLARQESSYSTKLDPPSDEFKLIDHKNRAAELYLRRNLNTNQLQEFDRVSLTQFLSLFNVYGRVSAEKLDRLYDILKAHSKKQQKITIQAAQKIQASGAQYQLSLDQRKVVGQLVTLLNKPSSLTSQVDFSEFNISRTDGVIKGSSEAMANDQFFERVTMAFRQISNVYDQRLTAVREARDICSNHSGKHVHSPINFHDLMDQKFIVREINMITKGPLERIKQEVRLQNKIKDNTFLKPMIQNMGKNLHHKEHLRDGEHCHVHEQTQICASTVPSMPSSFAAVVERVQGDKKIGVMNSIVRARKRVVMNNIENQLQKFLQSEMTIDEDTRAIVKRRKKRQSLLAQQLGMQSNTQKELEKIQKSNDLINKQLFFREVCKDLMIVRQIVSKMITKLDDKTEHLMKILFNEVIVKGISERYTNQLNLSQPVDPSRKELRQKVTKDGEMARLKLLKIVKLMIERKVVLKDDGEQDWYRVMAKYEDIRVLMSELVEQLNQQKRLREEHQEFPGINNEQLIENARSIWHSELDPSDVFMVLRRNLDEFLVKSGILSSKDESSLFLHNCLNQTRIGTFDEFKKSQFMQLAQKAVLRRQLLGLLETFNQTFNCDRLSLTDQVCRLQRQMIYNGIISQNIDFDQKRAKELTHVQKAIDVVQKLTFNPIRDTLAQVQLDTEANIQWINDWTKTHSKRNLSLVNFDGIKDHEIKLQNAAMGASNQQEQGKMIKQKNSKFDKKYPIERQLIIKSMLQPEPDDKRMRELFIASRTCSPEVLDDSKSGKVKFARQINYPLQFQQMLSPCEHDQARQTSRRAEQRVSLMEMQTDASRVQRAFAEMAGVVNLGVEHDQFQQQESDRNRQNSHRSNLLQIDIFESENSPLMNCT